VRVLAKVLLPVANDDALPHDYSNHMRDICLPSSLEEPTATTIIHLRCGWVQPNTLLRAGDYNSVNMRNLCMPNQWDTPLATPEPCVWSKRLQFAVLLLETYHHTLPNNAPAYHHTSLVCNFYLSSSYDSPLAAAEYPMQWQILWENTMLFATADNSFNVCRLFMPFPYDPSLAGH